LARWVAKGHAMRLALGFPLTAQEAQRSGLAQWLGAHGKVMGLGAEGASPLAALTPPPARRSTGTPLAGPGTPKPAAAPRRDPYPLATRERTEDKAGGPRAGRETSRSVFRGR